MEFLTEATTTTAVISLFLAGARDQIAETDTEMAEIAGLSGGQARDITEGLGWLLVTVGNAACED